MSPRRTTKGPARKLTVAWAVAVLLAATAFHQTYRWLDVHVAEGRTWFMENMSGYAEYSDLMGILNTTSGMLRAGGDGAWSVERRVDGFVLRHGDRTAFSSIVHIGDLDEFRRDSVEVRIGETGLPETVVDMKSIGTGACERVLTTAGWSYPDLVGFEMGASDVLGEWTWRRIDRTTTPAQADETCRTHPFKDAKKMRFRPVREVEAAGLREDAKP